eukprot:2123348-Amphidinium_carterae.1
MGSRGGSLRPLDRICPRWTRSAATPHHLPTDLGIWVSQALLWHQAPSRRHPRSAAVHAPQPVQTSWERSMTHKVWNEQPPNTANDAQFEGGVGVSSALSLGLPVGKSTRLPC